MAEAGCRRHGSLVGITLQGPLGVAGPRPRAHGVGHHLCSLLDGGEKSFARRACARGARRWHQPPGADPTFPQAEVPTLAPAQARRGRARARGRAEATWQELP